MDNSDFLSFFNGLNEQIPKELIVQNADKLVNLIKLTSTEPIKQKEKLKDYLNICQNPSEELLYTLRRLIGGLGSTGIEYRSGFTLAFTLLIQKHGESLNISEVLNCVHNETFVPKSESNHVKVCAMSGKLLMLKVILSIQGLSIENVLFIFKQLLSLSATKSMEESLLQIFNELLGKVFSNYYSSIKKTNKLFEGLFKQLELVCENKNKLQKASLFEYAIYLILLQHQDHIKGFLPTNITEELFKDNGETMPMMNLISAILTSPIKNNEFHYSFKLLYDCLIKLNEPKYAYKIWNILIDPKCFDHFKKISNKNCEMILFRYSSFLIMHFYKIDYVSKIFDDSFFISLLRLTTNKKTKYANDIASILITQLAKEPESNLSFVQEYCSALIKIFGSEQQDKYSPNGFRSFFLFIFSHLKEQDAYISSLISQNNNEVSIEDELFHISALKIIFLNIDNEEMKDNIMNYFLIKYYSSNRADDIEFEHIIEERIILLVISLFKPTFVEVNDKKELIHVKDAKAIKSLLTVHKKIQSLLKNKQIVLNCKNYMKYFKQLSAESSKEKDAKKYKKIIKIGLVVLMLYLKNENDYQQEMNDLFHISKFDKEWMKVYSDLTLSILHKGNNTLAELALGLFKTMSKYIGKDGFDVILQFLKETAIKREKNPLIKDDEDEEEDEHVEMENEEKKPVKKSKKNESKQKTSIEEEDE